MKGPTNTPKAGGSRGETPAKKKDVDKATLATPTTANVPKTGSSQGEEVDVSQLSAYAVYNNLVPGVKSYEDTSESTPASLKKKSKKRKKAQVKKQEQEADEAANVAAADEAVKIATSAAKKLISSAKKPTPATETPEKPVAVAAGSPRRITPTLVSKPSTSKGSPDKNGPVKVNESVSPTANGGDEESSPQKKKKRKKNKKKKTADAETQEIATTGASVNGSDSNRKAATEPPRKVRKVDKKDDGQAGNLLPNPFAKKGSPEKKGSPSKEALAVVGTVAVAGPPPSFATQKEKEKPKTELVLKNQKKKGKKGRATQVINSESESDDEDSGDAEQNGTASSEPPDLNCILNSKVVADSVKHGEELLAWLIHPQSISAFMEDHWEKQALLVKRGELFPEYFDWILSSAKLDDILRRNCLKFTKNIDVVNYENGERVTVSEDMTHRVRPAALWDYYSTGNSIRLLNPQSYCGPLRRLNSALQETFGTFVGANVYLTPPDAQGFAPHWDDIEAFVLQVEGRKRWKLYKPRNPNEVLPRFSSKDFGKEEETLGAPFIDVILEPGDLLYFPRGTIHQAFCSEGFHSLHITISCYQQNSWADLLKQHFSKAVDKLASTDVEFRKGLPLDYLSFMGLAQSKKKDSATLAKRKEFKAKLKRLVAKVGDLDADDAADEMGKKFIWDSLPPYLTRKEKDKTVVEDGEFLINGVVKNRVEMDPDTKVKLIRKHCVRFVAEESTFRLYHTLENPLVYHEEDPSFVEVLEECRAAVEVLINSYPKYVRIEDLPIADNDITKKIQLTADLWERGLLMTERRLEAGEILEDFDDYDEAEAESISQDEEDAFDDGEGSDSDLEDFIEGDDVGFDFDSSNDDEDEGLNDDDEMEMSDMSDDDDQVVYEESDSESPELEGDVAFSGSDNDGEEDGDVVGVNSMEDSEEDNNEVDDRESDESD